MTVKFDCKGCGTCCRNLPTHPLFAGMHNGDGVCFKLVDNKCSIYEDRPLVCNIYKGWEVIFKDLYTLEQWYELNKKGCKYLEEL